MEAFFRTHTYLIEHKHATFRRALMDEIDWRNRLIGIKGTRGVGKTTFLLEYAKEHFDAKDRRCLYINMNNFYFQGRGIHDFAGDFYQQGGRVLLIDQIFKQPDWSHELRRCYDSYPQLQIIFTGSSVMRLKKDAALKDIVTSYNLRGFSFREYVNLKSGTNFHPYTLQEIISHHEDIAREVAKKIRPLELFKEYAHHGFYPFFLEHRNYSENLLKTMNMMIEVDILLIKQIELKYLAKIKKLFYLLALNAGKAPNVSKLAEAIDTSRATVMNYIKYLADARLLNIVYHAGDSFPKKPAQVMLHNPNLIFTVYPYVINAQEAMQTFFVNQLWREHEIYAGKRIGTYIVDNHTTFRFCDGGVGAKAHDTDNTVLACNGIEVGHGHKIPLWLFGFLY